MARTPKTNKDNKATRTLANPAAAPTLTPVTDGEGALAKAMAKAMEKKKALLLAGQGKVMVNSLRGQLTTDPKKKIRLAQSSLIEAALTAFKVNNGEVGFAGEIPAILKGGRNSASEALSAFTEEDLEEAVEIVEG